MTSVPVAPLPAQLEPIRVRGDRFRFSDHDTRATLGFDRTGAGERLAHLGAQMAAAQNRLMAEGRRSVLLVLQGMDASGKDGVIRRVFTGVNPQGCGVTSFKAPSHLELAHDFLWRIHQACPARGHIQIFNRSHYEDVVTAEIIGSIDAKHAARRIDHVNAFERLLVEEGTAVVKVFLHVSKQEQRERLQARIDDPEKRWKFNADDLVARRRWAEYHDRYERAITATSTRWAPWHVVPADRKWVRDVVVAELVVRTLTEMDPLVPEPEIGALEVE